MELRELNYITAIGKTRHMSHAANELYISQPALYKSLRKIESEFWHTAIFTEKEMNCCLRTPDKSYWKRPAKYPF